MIGRTRLLLMRSVRLPDAVEVPERLCNYLNSNELVRVTYVTFELLSPEDPLGLFSVYQRFKKNSQSFAVAQEGRVPRAKVRPLIEACGLSDEVDRFQRAYAAAARAVRAEGLPVDTDEELT